MKKIFYVLLACFMILVGTSTQLITAAQQNNATINPAAVGPITYDLNVVSDVGSNNDIKYTVSNVAINASTAGYSSLTITVPAEFVANYTLPASWQEHISGNTINFIISNPATAGSVASVTDFLENNFFMTLATENVFPAQASHLTINISENLLSSREDENGFIHYYEFVPASGIDWLTAYNAAKTRTVNGLSGYLTTITSQEEQDFIYNSIAKYPGWLGATRMRNSDGTRINDESTLSTNLSNFDYNVTVANDWYWATGPETGTVFFDGATYSTGTTPANRYSFWAGLPSRQPDNGSPGEFVMMFAYQNTPYWNDTTINMRGIGLGYYVEYGGYPNEVPTQDNAGYQVAFPAPVKLEYLDVANNSLFTTTYLFGNIGENYTAPAAPSAPTGFAYLGLDSGSAPSTGSFQDTMLVVTHRYGQLFNANFHLNYTTSDTPPSTQTIAETQLLNKVTNPSRTGYTFNGWNTLADGSGQMWNFDTDAMPSANLDLHAQWSINQYQLSFNINGGDGNSPTTQNVDFGALATQPTTPQRQGYTFKGWNTLADGSGTTWDFATTTMLANNVTLYAQWLKDEEVLPTQPTNPNLPKTGDSSNVMLLSSLLVLTGITLIAISKKRYSK